MLHNIKTFINANKKSLVVKGEHLTPEFNSINTNEDFERSDRTKYTLENGEVYIITKKERQEMDYMPIWKLD